MQTDDERKARMREYYYRNKNKWKKYNRDNIASLSADEREKYNERQREYSRKHYLANREIKIEKAKQYQNENKEQTAKYSAEWFQKNKKKINARKRKHYHEVEKPQKQKDKLESKYISVTEAAKMLGAKLRTFREAVYCGYVAAARLGETGRYRLAKEDVAEMVRNKRNMPQEVKNKLGIERD